MGIQARPQSGQFIVLHGAKVISLTNRKGHPVWAPLSFSYPQWAGFGQMRMLLLGTIRSVDLEEVEQVVDVDGTIAVQVTRARWRVFTAAIVGVGQRIVVLCL